MFAYDVCVIGGCGRVGLPLSIAFADKGLTVVIYDLDKDRTAQVEAGTMPFREEGCQEKLEAVINRTLTTSDSPDSVSQARFVIVTIGTPVDKHLNPDFSAVLMFFKRTLPYLVAGQHVVLRSTVYPGTAEKIDRFLKENSAGVHVAFCPERIVEGKALSELASLPQIVSAFDDECTQAVSGLFRKLTPDIVVVEPIEAELAKLFTNAWRYIQFSIANQFFTLANDYGVDYTKVQHAITYKYPRAQGLPRPGFTAGPCLFKDTMQLAAFSNNSFFLGHAAMLVNEGLPNYIVHRLKARTDLASRTVGILGMAFKANSDDERDSLSFKLKVLLEAEALKVYCADPYVKRDYFVGAEDLVKACDVIVVASPHDDYRDLRIGEDKMLLDVWNLYGRGISL